MEQDTYKYTVMLNELLAFKPVTIKVPSRDGGYIRLAILTNCPWYRDFCASYIKFRRSRYRTYIKRCHTIAALRRMIAGDRTTIYAQRLMLVDINYQAAPVTTMSEDACEDTSF